MQGFFTPVKVGLVMIMGIVMTVAMVLKFSANWGQDEGNYQVYAYFDDVTGLSKHAQVRVAGIQVGEVSQISLENSRARVVLNIRGDVEIFEGLVGESFKNGATLSKRLSGIMGNYHLELTLGITGKRLQDGDQIVNVIASSGPEALMGNAEQIMRNISEITETFSNVLGGQDGEARLVQIVDDLNKNLTSLHKLLDGNAERVASIITNIDEMTKNAAAITELGNGELPALLREFEGAMAEARVLLRSADSGMGGVVNTTQETLDKLNASADKLDRILANFESVSDNVEQGKGSLGKILTEDAIADEAEGLLKDSRSLVKSGSDTLSEIGSLINPISKLDVDISMRSDYLIAANAFRIDFGVKLQPSPDKFYQVNMTMDPFGSTKRVQRLIESSATGPVYESIITRTNDIKFSVQYAKRWRWFIGRFGLIENTGGIGGDLYLFDDNLRFMFDLFAFNENEYPRLRGSGILYLSLFMPWDFAKAFYLTAGFDDPINPRSTDFFIGAGFRFTDNDVKSIMTLLPKP